MQNKTEKPHEDTTDPAVNEVNDLIRNLTKQAELYRLKKSSQPVTRSQLFDTVSHQLLK